MSNCYSGTFVTKTNGHTICLYTNKCKGVFNKVHGILYDMFKNTEKCIGIIYDDYNTDQNILNTLKSIHPSMNIFFVAPRRNTVALDDKKLFCERTYNLDFVPQYIKNIHESENIDDTELLYIKHRGSSEALDVRLLPKIDILSCSIDTNYIIQQNVSNPHLIDNTRYKLRTYVILFNKKMYASKHYRGNLATKELDISNMNVDDAKNMNIIHQTSHTKYLLSDNIECNDEIFNDILLSYSKLKKVYISEIENIDNNQYVILGLDYVINNDKKAFLIEINHRPNFSFPAVITNNVDIPVLVDTYKLLITNTIVDTSFICIE